MTDKQIKAANRMLQTLARVRESLEKTNANGCLTLEQVKERAIDSNLACVRTIKEQLRVAKKLAV